MSKVTYVPIDGEEVSAQWFCLLEDIRFDDGVVFNVNEGHRTMARQWFFWNQWVRFRKVLAAFPSPNAPHIRTGKFWHALDLTNPTAVARAAAKRGVALYFPVPGESWHAEAVNPDKLQEYYVKHARPRTIKKGIGRHEDVQTLQVLLRRAGYLPKAWKAHYSYTIKVRRAVRKFQKDHGMKVDGVVGTRTWYEIRKAAKS